jgi:hypothetical protein
MGVKPAEEAGFDFNGAVVVQIILWGGGEFFGKEEQKRNIKLANKPVFQRNSLQIVQITVQLQLRFSHI